MIVTKGFTQSERKTIASLYWAAFGQKLGRVMGPDAKALAFIEDVLDPAHAICARDADNGLLGVVGFKTVKGALVGGAWRDMTRHYGGFGAAWRLVFLTLLERDTEDKRFLMDGIFVAAHARGHGVGTALLGAICQEARDRGYDEVRLDVADTNPRAKALYEREGFEPRDTQRLGLLRHVFGFASARMMVKRV